VSVITTAAAVISIRLHVYGQNKKKFYDFVRGAHIKGSAVVWSRYLTFCGQNAELLIVEAGGTYSYHRAF
jgi:hypothetical protein